MISTKTTLLSRATKRSSLFALLLGVAVSFTACKNDTNYQPEEIAALAITNASTKVPSVDFYLENSKVNSQAALLFGGTIDYLRAFAGDRSATVTASSNSKSLLTEKINLTTGQYHSLYIVDQKVNNIESQAFVLIKDDLTPPATGKTKVRFANLSSDAPTLTMEITGAGTTFEDKDFKAFTAFKEIAPAKYTITLKNKTTGTVVATLADAELLKDSYYTIWAKGLVTTTVNEQRLTIKVTKH